LSYWDGLLRNTSIVLIKTTEMELMGINIAATSGVNWPLIAKLKPMVLYANEKIKQAFRTTFA
jgi:hypothetical protein